MTTLEMLNEAQKTGAIYICGDNIYSMRYSVLKGFHDNTGEWDASNFTYINELLDINTWQLLKPKKMTFEQIQEKLGYDIEIVNEV